MLFTSSHKNLHSSYPHTHKSTPTLPHSHFHTHIFSPTSLHQHHHTNNKTSTFTPSSTLTLFTQTPLDLCTTALPAQHYHTPTPTSPLFYISKTKINAPSRSYLILIHSPPNTSTAEFPFLHTQTTTTHPHPPHQYPSTQGHEYTEWYKVRYWREHRWVVYSNHKNQQVHCYKFLHY